MLSYYYYTIFLLRRSFPWNATSTKGTVLRVFLPLVLQRRDARQPNVVIHTSPVLAVALSLLSLPWLFSNFRAGTPMTRWRVIDTTAFARSVNWPIIVVPRFCNRSPSSGRVPWLKKSFESLNAQIIATFPVGTI